MRIDIFILFIIVSLTGHLFTCDSYLIIPLHYNGAVATCEGNATTSTRIIGYPFEAPYGAIRINGNYAYYFCIFYDIPLVNDYAYIWDHYAIAPPAFYNRVSPNEMVYDSGLPYDVVEPIIGQDDYGEDIVIGWIFDDGYERDFRVISREGYYPSVDCECVMKTQGGHPLKIESADISLSKVDYDFIVINKDN
jgi:hypothetical protein